jgi:hypothetical membrane protein
MHWRRYALCGIIGPTVAYCFIAISIGLSPWFNWRTNALSDLGHAITSEAASWYNFGLLLSGFLTTIYAVKALRAHAQYTSCCLVTSALLLQLVATFDEVYGFLHFLVSVLLFASFGLGSLVYAVEARSKMASVAFVISLGSWLLYWTGAYAAGIAIPEAISSLATGLWIISSATEILRGKST